MKKKVPTAFKPDTFRVFRSDDEMVTEKSSAPPILPLTNVLGQPVDQLPCEDFSCRRITKKAARNLEGDVKIMLAPVNDVLTDGINNDAGGWWQHNASQKIPSTTPCKLVTGCHPASTTARIDYQYRGKGIAGNTRNISNPYRTPAAGIAPVTLLRRPDGKQRIMKEAISYDHDYNSRVDPNYPFRGSRIGSIVWSEMSDDDVTRMMDKYGYSNNLASPPDRSCDRICPPCPRCPGDEFKPCGQMPVYATPFVKPLCGKKLPEKPLDICELTPAAM